MYYIYSIIDNRTNKPFYIGKGKEKNQRHLDHLSETIETTLNVHKFYRIQYLREMGYEIKFEILYSSIADETEAYNIEEELIRKYGRKGYDKNGILTNVCRDNRPPNWLGRKQSLTHIKRRVESYKNTCKTTGRTPHSEETKNKISESLMGEKNPFYNKKHTKESREKMSKIKEGNLYSAKWYEFISPENKKYVVKGFSKFCRENNLPTATMEKILKMKTTTTYGKCKGWMVEMLNIDTETDSVIEDNDTNE